MVEWTGMLRIIWPLVALLVGCVQATTAEPTGTVAGPSEIQIVVVTDDFAAGQPRVPFILYSGPEQVAEVQSVALTAYDLSEGTPRPRWTGGATGYSDYVVPYWVAYPELPHAGIWGLVAEVTLTDGKTSQAQFAIQVAAENQAPAVGQRPPASENRTLASESELEKLTSDWEPEPGLYHMTVAEAMASGRPTVVTFATPAFCQTDICAPVVDSVKEAFREHGDEANFIHIEVYKTFNPELVLADEMVAWGFSSEPWTYVLDADGQVAARLGGPLSPRELAAALTPLLP